MIFYSSNLPEALLVFFLCVCAQAFLWMIVLYDASVTGRKVDIDMLVSGSLAECMVVVYMKSMSELYM